MMSKLGILLALQLVLLMPEVMAQEMNTKITDTLGREKLVGKINKQGLTQNSFAAWFNANYKNYAVDNATVNAIGDKLNTYEITVFMGTWCGDSRREVPRFYKILETLNFPMEQLTVVAVDNDRARYKKSPTGEEKGLNIKKVPTFILYKNDKEVNRIIETPVISLEKDLLQILMNKAYIPKYATLK